MWGVAGFGPRDAGRLVLEAVLLMQVNRCDCLCVCVCECVGARVCVYIHKQTKLKTNICAGAMLDRRGRSRLLVGGLVWRWAHMEIEKSAFANKHTPHTAHPDRFEFQLLFNAGKWP